MLINSHCVILQTPQKKKRGDYKNIYRYVWQGGICQRVCVSVYLKRRSVTTNHSSRTAIVRIKAPQQVFSQLWGIDCVCQTLQSNRCFAVVILLSMPVSTCQLNTL